ncbi:MFS transporter [Brucella endophytica]|uniref:MFS transporter n=1 Tax=Brucella endophytica TaxID=1963359 RepID=A0A916SFJ5_9HYPH|nr:MFS transporter [Brucella endophytica]GGA96692.1 MFS transporter [Brucella endophytica]
MDRRFIWLALGSFAIGTEGYVISSLLPNISADLGVSLPHTGYLITAFALAYAIGAPVLTSLVASADRRRVITATLALFVCGNLIAATSSSFAMLMAARIVMALAAGPFTAMAQATAVALAGPKRRASAIAIIAGGVTVAVTLGAPLGALIGNLVGWRGNFVTVAIFGGLATLILWRELPKGLTGPRQPLSERLAAAVQPGVFPTLVTTFLFTVGSFAIFTYIAPLAMQGAGLGVSALPLLLLLFGIGAAIGNLAGGYLADRFGAFRTGLIVLALDVIILATFSVIPLFAPRPLAGVILIAAMVPWGLIGWAFPPAQASHIVSVAPKLAPITLSLNNSVVYLGVAFGSFIGSLVLQYRWLAELGFVAALFALLAIVSLLVFQQPAALRAVKRVKSRRAGGKAPRQQMPGAVAR